MSIIAEFRVRSSELNMAETLTALPDIELEGIQQVGTDPQRPYGLFWVSGGDIDAFDEKVREDESVTDVECYTRLEDRALYRVRISETVEVVGYPVWVELGAEEMNTRYVDGWWETRMRFPDRDALGKMRDWCLTNDVEFDLQSIYTDEGRPSNSGLTAQKGGTRPSGLTAQQQEVLQAALEQGYFEIPRQATLSDIAAELDISSQATSERLRRAHRRLISQYLS